MEPNCIEFNEKNLVQCLKYLQGKGPKVYWWFDYCELNTTNEVIWKSNKLLIIATELADLLLKTIYDDPKTTRGRDQIYQYVQENFVGISQRRVMEFLRNQESCQLQFREKKKRVTT